MRFVLVQKSAGKEQKSEDERDRARQEAMICRKIIVHCSTDSYYCKVNTDKIFVLREMTGIRTEMAGGVCGSGRNIT
jgi:hypothetical protein